MHLNHPQTIPHPSPDPWKNCLPQNQSLVPKRLGTADLYSVDESPLYQLPFGTKRSNPYKEVANGLANFKFPKI